MIRLIVLDADGTIWDHHNVTELRGPFKLVSKDVAEGHKRSKGKVK